MEDEKPASVYVSNDNTWEHNLPLLDKLRGKMVVNNDKNFK